MVPSLAHHPLSFSFILNHGEAPEEKLHQTQQPQPPGSRARCAPSSTPASPCGTAAARCLPRTPLVPFVTLLLSFKAFFKDHWQCLGQEPAVHPPAPSTHPIVDTYNKAIPRTHRAMGVGPFPNSSRSLCSSSSLCRCSRNFREHRRAGMLKSRWVFASICSSPPHWHVALIQHLRKRL